MKRVIRFSILVAMISFAVTSCKKNNGDDDDNGSVTNNDGKLTVIGLPEGPAYDVEVYESGTDLSTLADRTTAITNGKILAHGSVKEKGGNIFSLYKEASSTEKWSGSGNNLIVLLSESNMVNPKIAVIATVTKGTGEINYNAFAAAFQGGEEGIVAPPDWIFGTWEKDGEEIKFTSNDIFYKGSSVTEMLPTLLGNQDYTIKETKTNNIYEVTVTVKMIGEELTVASFSFKKGDGTYIEGYGPGSDKYEKYYKK
jgi:hypothetical protein